MHPAVRLVDINTNTNTTNPSHANSAAFRNPAKSKETGKCFMRSDSKFLLCRSE